MKGSIKGILWDKDGTLVDNFSIWIRRDLELVHRLAEHLLPSAALGNRPSTRLVGSSAKLTDHLRRAEPVEASNHNFLDAQVLELLGVKQGRITAQGLLASASEEKILRSFGLLLQENGATLPADFISRAKHFLQQIIEKEEGVTPLSTPHADAAIRFAGQCGLYQGLSTADTRLHAETEFKYFGWDAFIQFWSCGDEVKYPKPDPWTISRFLEHFALQPAEVLVIGDSPVDAEMSRNGGTLFAAVLSGSGSNRDFEPFAPIEIFSDLGYFIPWLKKQLA